MTYCLKTNESAQNLPEEIKPYSLVQRAARLFMMQLSVCNVLNLKNSKQLQLFVRLRNYAYENSLISIFHFLFF